MDVIGVILKWNNLLLQILRRAYLHETLLTLKPRNYCGGLMPALLVAKVVTWSWRKKGFIPEAPGARWTKSTWLYIHLTILAAKYL